MFFSFVYVKNNSVPPAKSESFDFPTEEEMQNQTNNSIPSAPQSCMEWVGNVAERLVIRPLNIMSETHNMYSAELVKKYSKTEK